MPIDQAKLDAWFDWRERMNNRHRTMTLGEYRAWQIGGDLISHPSNSNALRGGLTLLLKTPPVIGKVDGWEEPPTL
jgi:hypothetical protein